MSVCWFCHAGAHFYNACHILNAVVDAYYRNDPKFFGQIGVGKQCRPRSEEQSDPCPHSLQFRLHLLGALLLGKAILFKLQEIFWVSEYLGFLR